ncbi:hypothetical protein V502_04382 [Pseudogymnoascus sp. VKM F-4520 (FW-2644)]|nr:hypothetical protein V502_04382 [Pseudogymnoascus sp. VKM F-4520 (FW-2644)]
MRKGSNIPCGNFAGSQSICAVNLAATSEGEVIYTPLSLVSHHLNPFATLTVVLRLPFLLCSLRSLLLSLQGFMVKSYMPNATMKSIILSFLYASIQILTVEAAAASFLHDSFKSWIWQSTIVVDNWLYIDGGDISSDAEGDNVPNNQTFSIDLSESWNTKSVAASASPRNNSFGTVRRPQLYYDESHHTVYSSSGLFYNWSQNSKEPIVWGFTPEVDGKVEWTEKFSKSLESSFPLVSYNWDALTTTSGSKHYALGGAITFDEGLQQMAMEQLVTYDYKTQTFKNQTLPFHSYGGEAQFVPQYGEEGVILFFGGLQRADRSVSGDDGVQNISTIQVYDVHTGTFYNQTATNPPIGSFIFGGTAGTSSSNTATILSKVYILTLPYFNWIEAPNPANHFRAGQSCALIGPKSTPNRHQRQMVVNNGMKIFDLGNLTWSDDYDASATPYVRHSVISNYYANNPSYTVKWDDSALSSIFNNSVSPITTTAAPTATTAATDDTKKSNTAAIAGGVVGGVAALAIAGALVFFWRRRRASKFVKNGDGQDDLDLSRQASTYKEDTPLREMPADAMRGELPAATVRTELSAVDAPIEIYTDERHELPAGMVHRYN